jgi:hypothetical protein
VQGQIRGFTRKRDLHELGKTGFAEMFGYALIACRLERAACDGLRSGNQMGIAAPDSKAVRSPNHNIPLFIKCSFFGA